MQSSGQAIESRASDSFNVGVEQSSATGRRSGDGATSFRSNLPQSDLSRNIAVNPHGGWYLRTSREAGQYGTAAVSLKDVAASLIGGENVRR
jgi:hypothetical protein